MKAAFRNLPRHSVLTLEDGRKEECARLGKGRYTTAWRSVENPATVYLQVNDKDMSKEIMSKSSGAHIPVLERIGYFDADCSLYRTRYYEPLTASNKPAWAQFKALKKHAETALKALWSYRQEPNTWGINNEFSDLVDDDASLSDELKENVADLIRTAGDYGEYLIEIAKRNLAVEGERLILLDPLYDYREVRNQREEAMKKAQRLRYA